MTRFTDSPFEPMMTRRPEGGKAASALPLYLPATPAMAVETIAPVSPAWDSVIGS